LGVDRNSTPARTVLTLEIPTMEREKKKVEHRHLAAGKQAVTQLAKNAYLMLSLASVQRELLVC
jgi:hypothetical protein